MGIFDEQAAGLFTTYKATVVFRDRCMGGTPKNPAIIEGWLRSKAGFTKDSDELRAAMLRTLEELGVAITTTMTFEEIVAASEGLASNKNTNGFKLDTENGLYLEGRTIKAMLKESVNIIFPYQSDKWGLTRKAPRSFTAERVFVNPDKVYLGRKEPDGVELFIGHTTGPRGPQSNLTYHEFVRQAEIQFDVMVAEDSVPHEAWPAIWVHAQENGLGSLRSQGYGRFDITGWEVQPNKPLNIHQSARASKSSKNGADADSDAALLELAAN